MAQKPPPSVPDSHERIELPDFSVVLPPDADEERAALVEQFALRRLRGLFDETGNGVHAFRAYHTARFYRVPVPDWVLTYLDDCAEELLIGEGPQPDYAVRVRCECRQPLAGERPGPAPKRSSGPEHRPQHR